MKRNDKLKWLLFILFPAAFFVFSQFSIGRDSFRHMEAQLFILNILVFEALAFLLLSISGNMKAALIAEMIPVQVLAVANSFIRIFRGSYIVPWDVIALQTAANVAGNYEYRMDRNALIGTAAFLIMFVLILFLFPKEKISIPGKKRFLTGTVSLAFILLLFFILPLEGPAKLLKIHNSRFAVTEYYTGNGIIPGFMVKLSEVPVKVPEGYSKEAEKAKLESIEVSGTLPETGEMPDVIVIMNEAFSDLAVDAPFKTNKDYMPFVHSLKGKENTVTGHAHVSILGGATPNSEFEFLTGYSMAFLPENSIPFQAFIKKRTDSLGWYFSSLGYQTFASHPFLSSGWDRTVAWPNLGFEETLFLEDFEELNPEGMKVRDYVSDEAMYEALIKKIDEREDREKPLFAFNVTMQNHSGYSKMYDNLEKEIEVEGVDESEGGHSQALINYLDLIVKSDRAFEKLISHYENVDKKTVILMYGDHQPDPGVAEPIYNLNGMDMDSLTPEDVMNDHVVPFVIWANYDIDEKEDVDISLNYLGNLLLKETGIPLTGYRTYLERYSEEYPLITAVGGRDSSGKLIDHKKLIERLPDLSAAQYYELFDKYDE